jgi:hypothetical protein
LTDQESDDDTADRTFKPKKTPPSSADESSDPEVIAIERPGHGKMKQTVKRSCGKPTQKKSKVWPTLIISAMRSLMYI